MRCSCELKVGQNVKLSNVCIADFWVFRDLDPQENKALLRNVVIKTKMKGQWLFAQGEKADELFLIKSGLVKLIKLMEDGTEVILDIRKAGDFIGENIFAAEGCYPLGAFCMEETLTCGFNKSTLEKVIKENPDIGIHIIKNLSERIAWLTERVGNMAATHIDERLYRVLFSIAQEHGVKGLNGMTIQFPLTHEDLGFIIGAHRVSVTRALKALQRDGRVIQEAKRFTVI